MRILLGKLKGVQVLPGIIFLGGFFITILWEAKSRYVYPYIVMILPSAACSMEYYGRLLAGGIGRIAGGIVSSRERKQKQKEIGKEGRGFTMDEYMQFSAKTKNEAITKACIELGVSSDQLEIQVISEGSNGFFGIGSKPAVIKVRKIESVSEEEEMKEIVETVKLDSFKEEAPVQELSLIHI